MSASAKRKSSGMTKEEKREVAPLNERIRVLEGQLSGITSWGGTLATAMRRWETEAARGVEAARAARAAEEDYEDHRRIESLVAELPRLAADYGSFEGAVAADNACMHAMQTFGLECVERADPVYGKRIVVTRAKLEETRDVNRENAKKTMERMRRIKRAQQDGPEWLTTHAKPPSFGEWMAKAVDADRESREAEEVHRVHAQIKDLTFRIAQARSEANAMRKRFREAKKQ